MAAGREWEARALWRGRARDRLRDPASFEAFLRDDPPAEGELERGRGEWLMELARARWEAGSEREREAEGLARWLLREGARAGAMEPAPRLGVGWRLEQALRQTPLAAASARGAVGIMRALLEAGADPKGRNGAGESPLELAGAAGSLAACELLAEWGAADGERLEGLPAAAVAACERWRLREAAGEGGSQGGSGRGWL